MAQQNGNLPRTADARRASRGLGTLEGQLMEALWATTSKLSVQEVVDALGPGHNYKTVMTVLNRLVEKQLLERQLDGRAYRYHPRQSREAFLRNVADDLVRGYIAAYGNTAAGHLTGAVDSVAPRPAAAPGATPPPAPPAPAAHEEERRSPLATVIAIAAALQLITLLLRRGKRGG